MRGEMLDAEAVQRLLAPYELALDAPQVEQLLGYLDLLLKWNARINLTAVRAPEECVTRHFGESLYLRHVVDLRGSLLDIGSGAGFPGLALKITAPQLDVTLLEPSARKRAFLKEVARLCQMPNVEVRGERLEEYAGRLPGARFEFATARAVGDLASLVPNAARCLRFGGRLCLWLTRSQAQRLPPTAGLVTWEKSVLLPLSREREIWIGGRTGAAGGP